MRGAPAYRHICEGAVRLPLASPRARPPGPERDRRGACPVTARAKGVNNYSEDQPAPARAFPFGLCVKWSAPRTAVISPVHVYEGGHVVEGAWSDGKGKILAKEAGELALLQKLRSSLGRLIRTYTRYRCPSRGGGCV
ncbi:hypothetical protein VTO73DRAFT_10571 [Trametes versicolor]